MTHSPFDSNQQPSQSGQQPSEPAQPTPQAQSAQQAQSSQQAQQARHAAQSQSQSQSQPGYGMPHPAASPASSPSSRTQPGASTSLPPLPQMGGAGKPAYASTSTPAGGQPRAGQSQPWSTTPVHVGSAAGTQQQPASAAPATKQRKQGRGARAAVVVLSILLPLGIAGGAFAGYYYADQFGTFDQDAVEEKVAGVLREDYGLADLETVTCPSVIKVAQGDTFQCEFEYAGGQQTVTVTQGSQSGQLVVGAPSS